MASSLADRLNAAARRSPIAKFLYYYPFTVVGTVVLAASVLLFVTGILVGNSYGVFTGMSGLLLLFVFGAVARLLSRRYDATSVAWSPPGAVYAGLPKQYEGCAVDGPSAPAFFRIHCAARGSLTAGRWTSLSYYYDAPSDSKNRIRLPLEVPVCGVLTYTAQFAVRDIFGLTVGRFTEPVERDLTIQPQPLSDDKVLPLEAAGGYEETSRQKSLDEEKYYMREYVPGDRSRDINWKASARLQRLVTRISPNTQEKAKLLTIFFRPFSSAMRESLESIVHLNYAKRWMLAFLRLVKQQFPEYHFRVYSGGPAELLETEQDIEVFSRRVATIPFRSPEDQIAYERDPSGTIVFTTIYDVTLGGFLSELPSKQVYVFTTATSQDGTPSEVRTVEVRIRPHSGFLAVPWALYREGVLPGAKAIKRTWPVDRSQAVQVYQHPLAVQFVGL